MHRAPLLLQHQCLVNTFQHVVPSQTQHHVLRRFVRKCVFLNRCDHFDHIDSLYCNFRAARPLPAWLIHTLCPQTRCLSTRLLAKSTNKGLRISFLLGKDSEASVLRFFRNSGFHQQHYGTVQFILHAVNTQHLCRGSLSYSLVWSVFTGCIELLITSKMV